MISPKPTLLVAAALLVGCSSKHPAHAVVAQFADGVVAGDVEQVFATHIDSTLQGDLCRKELRDILDKARTLDAEGCATTVALYNQVASRAPDELEFALQTGRWVCENPQGTCVDYARDVFVQAFAVSKFAPPVELVSIVEVTGDATDAAAIVELRSASGDANATLALRLVGEGWRITYGVLTR